MAGSAKTWHGGLDLTRVEKSRPLSLVRAAFPLLLGGWFAFVIVTTFPGMVQRPVALRDGQATAAFLDDFVVFHAAGKYAPDVGGGVYEPAVISRLEARTTDQEPGQVVVLPFFNPPPALLALWPLGLLPVGLAASLWLVLGVAVAAVLVRMLAREVGFSGELNTVLLVLGACASLPFYQAVVHGQMTFLLVGGFCLFCTGVLRGRGMTLVLAGLLLLALKPVFLVLPLLFLVVRREFHVLAAFVLVEGLLVILAALAFGTDLPMRYVSMSLQALSWDEVNGISTYGMFGWTGFWRGVIGPDARELQSVLTAASTGVTLAVTALAFDRTRERPLVALSACALASLLVSPHSYAQDILLLCIPFLLLAESDGWQRGVVISGVLTWFALYFHFDVLEATRVGPANVALIFLSVWVLRGAISVASASRSTSKLRPVRIANVRRRPALPSEAAGS